MEEGIVEAQKKGSLLNLFPINHLYGAVEQIIEEPVERFKRFSGSLYERGSDYLRNVRNSLQQKVIHMRKNPITGILECC